MKRSKKDDFLGFSSELLQGVRDGILNHEDEAVNDAEIVGIKRATLAMIEARVKDETIIRMLQKYWDLRLSEAEGFLAFAKKDFGLSNK